MIRSFAGDFIKNVIILKSIVKGFIYTSRKKNRRIYLRNECMIFQASTVNAREKPQGGGVLFWASLNTSTQSKKKTHLIFLFVFLVLKNFTITAIKALSAYNKKLR